MGSKKKSSRIFGKSVGIYKRLRSDKYTGRPKYKIVKRITSSKSRNISLCVKRIKKTVSKKTIDKKPVFISHTLFDDTGCTVRPPIKLKIRKVLDTSENGYRIVNLECLQSHVTSITMHACQCLKAIQLASIGESPLSLQTEIRSLGLASVLSVQSVWGSIATGNGPSHLNEILSTLNSPGISQPTFSAIEHDIGKWWSSILDQSMIEAGQEERQIAIEKGDFHNEIPSITVIMDGGWSKRTHKHSYNALGGVAIIIGKRQKKLLHIGVRNRYCYICNSAESRQESVKPHSCFKNWNHDSQSMESDIIIEGFKQAESKHGLRYMRVIGDGDSSVFSNIREQVPVWGRYVTKEECANHICKCYRSNLEKLVADNPIYKGRHNLTKNVRIRLVSAVRCAIRMRAKEVKEKGVEKTEAVRNLRHDIINSVHHVFGKHSNCSDFCKAKLSSSTTSNDSILTSLQDQDESSDIFEDQIKLWTEGTSIEAQEETRKGTHINYSDVEQYIIQDVCTLLSRISEKADRLLGNNTTNLAESWMHIRCKFDGGKLYNLCNRGSWHGRCFGGGLRMNFGPEWSPKVWQKTTATQPGFFFTRHFKRSNIRLANSTRYKAKYDTHQKRWKRKMRSLTISCSKKARRSYGPEAIDVTEDIPVTDLAVLQSDFLEKHINISEIKIKEIATATIKQSQSDNWHSERKKRITCSNFGKIIRRRPSILVKNLVKNLLYSKFRGTFHTKNGLLHERSTIEEYRLKKAEENVILTVESSGLIINNEHKFLAGSPDGIVIVGNGEKGLLEVKNLVHSKPINLFQAAANKNFCLEIRQDKLFLKQNHDYYYQCQGLLNVGNFHWLDFVVRTINPYQLFIQRIQRDLNLWNNVMLPKLTAFYHSAILPELACLEKGRALALENREFG
ncbi:unnamed protein product [Mytilus edulis]|uniref:YqaJ viral recombinase domain-containing protein n=1 Tax=Mytilus edulis TaxID=6550 RepID=A0A8S3R6H4_MYTED|nr:unnamed protein product [Mytilus edulis]